MMGQEIGNELDEQNGKVDSVSAVCLNGLPGALGEPWWLVALLRNEPPGVIGRLAALCHTKAVLTQNHWG